jgi:hypothetical protein
VGAPLHRVPGEARAGPSLVRDGPAESEDRLLLIVRSRSLLPQALSRDHRQSAFRRVSGLLLALWRGTQGPGADGCVRVVLGEYPTLGRASLRILWPAVRIRTPGGGFHSALFALPLRRLPVGARAQLQRLFGPFTGGHTPAQIPPTRSAGQAGSYLKCGMESKRISRVKPWSLYRCPCTLRASGSEDSIRRNCLPGGSAPA